ncbi:histone-fold-containing protein [Butyriboletus roseoflavus]|nr:histone-fold-containing protein [Butyriboletus roseoflavus]
MVATPSTASKAPAKAPASDKATKKAAKTSGAPADGEKKKRRKARKETYSSYIYKVLKQVHPDTWYLKQGHGHPQFQPRHPVSLASVYANISSSLGLLELASYSKKSTIASREIQTAVRLILPGELSKHAISEGTKSVTKASLSCVANRFLSDQCSSFQHLLPNRWSAILFRIYCGSHALL